MRVIRRQRSAKALVVPSLPLACCHVDTGFIYAAESFEFAGKRQDQFVTYIFHQQILHDQMVLLGRTLPLGHKEAYDPSGILKTRKSAVLTYDFCRCGLLPGGECHKTRLAY